MIKSFFLFYKNIFQFLLQQSLFKRRIILVLLDSILIFSSFIIANFLTNGEFGINQSKSFYSLYGNVIILEIIFYALTNQYKPLARYSGTETLYSIGIRNIFSTFLVFNIIWLVNKNFTSVNFFIILWLVKTFLIIISRLTIKDIISKYHLSNYKDRKNICIYGAGGAGAQLAAALKLDKRYQIKYFIDDNNKLWGRKLDAIEIISFKKLKSLKYTIDEVLLAIPSLKRSRKKEIIELLRSANIKTYLIPTISEITSGKSKINKFRSIEIKDLLERDIVYPNVSLLEKSIKSNCICVSGSGGSIGSELCRQILKLNPSKLILLERNEASLFKIKEELEQIKYNKVNIKSILGSAKNENLLKELFVKENINVIFHAAAYKHVPLVEENPLEGIKNNIFSSLSICRAAKFAKVQKIILISSDKAVRPTNIMGASKRVCELIFQAYAKESEEEKISRNSIFSMVRFGNVLDSSGSVLPKFRRQISHGGPITITHPKITRYFMTIPEAAELVLQASSLAKGGEVFLLDMGKPIKIVDLAEKMVNLSGLNIKNKENKNGDLEIIYTGLRPGEKLYEELLVNAESNKTEHPLIFKAKESFLSKNILLNELNKLESKLSERNKNDTLEILNKLVPEWKNSKTN